MSNTITVEQRLLDKVEEARKNLIEAIKLFFEMASPQEILASWHTSILHSAGVF